jgi:hypothetical protein
MGRSSGTEGLGRLVGSAVGADGLVSAAALLVSTSVALLIVLAWCSGARSLAVVGVDEVSTGGG